MNATKCFHRSRWAGRLPRLASLILIATLVTGEAPSAVGAMADEVAKDPAEVGQPQEGQAQEGQAKEGQPQEGQAGGEGQVREPLPVGVRVVRVEVFPTRIELAHRLDYRQLLMTGYTDQGEVVDLTRRVEPLGTPRTVTISDQGLVRALADGEEQLTFQFGEHQLRVDVRVRNAEQRPRVSFVRDVQPALSRTGCNSGTCHGSKDGKNGFKLSLRGYDPLYDHRALTDDLGARRFNRAAPDQSLMLLKSTGSIPHVGGVRMQVGDPYYELLRSWIAAGAPLDLDSSRVVSLRVLPENPIVPRAGMVQQMVVLATYSDGQVRDVTREAFVESGNIEVIEAGEQGQLKMLRRGEAPVLVRYEGAYAATTLTVMGDRSEFSWRETPEYNYIDHWVYQKLQRVKVLPSDLCTDSEFVRRVYLDLTGLPPTSEQARAFLADPRASREKRDALVDDLVGGPSYIEHWTNKWADLLQVNRKFLGEEGAIALRNWIKDAVARNVPYDQFARQILTASGSTLENPPASYYKILRTPAEAMENTTHLFLAVRFNCNKCHDHPFERWTQDQYYELAAYFAQVGRKPDPQFAGQNIGGSAVEGATPLVEVVYDTGSGEVTHDRTGQTTAPGFPFQHEDVAADQVARRDQLAHWITSPSNPYFARSYANRLWGYLFGPGIVEPIDDIRAGNPPTNPRLLDALTDDFVRSGFDVRHMLRTICKSRAYQHSVTTNRWNEDDELNYSHALPRRLPAEVLYDALHVAAGSIPQIPGAPPGFRAAELPDAGVSIPFLDDFGRPVRESACECERTSGMVLGPILKLVNGATVAEALSDPQNALTRLVAEQPDDDQLIEEVFMRFLSRAPTDQEIALGREALQAAGSDHPLWVQRLAEYEKQLPDRIAAWESALKTEAAWTPLEFTEMSSTAGADLAMRPDKSVFVSGKQGQDVYTLTAQTSLQGITGIRLEALPDPSLPAGGPGRAQNGNFVLNELQLTASPASQADGVQPVRLRNASADFSQDGWSVAGAIDGNPGTGWAVSPAFNTPHEAVFETSADVGGDGMTRLVLTFTQQFDPQHQLGRFRVSVTNSARPIRLAKLPEPLTQALAVPASERTVEQQAVVLQHYEATDRKLAELRTEVEQSANALKNRRLVGVQDLAWALINSPSFLFNR